jgi:hypothetical protein
MSRRKYDWDGWCWKCRKKEDNEHLKEISKGPRPLKLLPLKQTYKDFGRQGLT